MYFPGVPLLALDPIFLATPEGARDRLVAQFDLALTEAGFALGYRFDIVLRGRAETPMENRTRSEEHTSELQSLMRISYAGFCLKKKTHTKSTNQTLTPY